MKKLLIFGLLLMHSALIQAANYSEGTHYTKLPPQLAVSGDKVEVLEFFSYSCPHCYSFEPYLNTWKKSKPANVEFVRVPAIFRPEWEVQARAYYALSNMGVIDDMHGKIFAAIHKNKKRLNKKEAITDFVAQQGIDKKEFVKQYNSFSVDGMVRKAKKKQQAYRIQGVPSVIVNGKYLSSGSMSGSYDNLIRIIDHLTGLESK